LKVTAKHGHLFHGRYQKLTATKYFEPSTKEFIINYRVENLEALLTQLRKDSVTILDKVETADYGKFVHILDIEFEKLGEKIGAKTTK
jgi:hypothetical protein